MLKRAVLLLLLAPLAAVPKELPPAARAEVLTLLSRLESSGCQFSRNDAWYAASEARTHLLRKLEYLEKNGSPASAEAFIEQAASKSSASGKPYRVRCGASEAASADWLQRELRAMRTGTR
jgi:hypothetical protein